MNRRLIPFMILVVVMVAIFPIYQGWVTAQEEGPQPSGEDTEPQVVEINDPEALVSSNFTYQGLLKNSSVPVNGNCDFIWDIYNDYSAGTSLATDPDSNIQVINGLFTAVIDIPAAVFDGSLLYLEIQVSCPTGSGTFTTLTPRQELRAVPYSLGIRLPFSETISTVSSPVFSITNNSVLTTYPSLESKSVGGDGVRGFSTGSGNADNGVYGETNSADSAEAGVKGHSTSSAAGGYFLSDSGNGVHGRTDSPTDFGGYFRNSSVETSGGALYAYGDAKQSLAGDGFVKAAVYLICNDTSSSITRYFNNVNTTAISVVNGTSTGRCTVDFGFAINNRFVVAIATGTSGALMVTFDFDTSTDTASFFRANALGNGVNGELMVLVY